MVKINASVQAHDRCDGDDVLIELLSIVSSEPDDASFCCAPSVPAAGRVAFTR